jgi:hypothetical protein
MAPKLLLPVPVTLPLGTHPFRKQGDGALGLLMRHRSTDPSPTRGSGKSGHSTPMGVFTIQQNKVVLPK